MQSLRASVILTTFVVVTLICIPWQKSGVLFGLKRRKSFPQRYHRFLCRLFGIRVRVIGTPIDDRGVLIVANHTSWLDILVFSAAAKVSFVAKSEVQSWPFFSTLARLQETVFVERNRRAQTGDARDHIRDRVLAGDALVLFPEGTSSDGNKVKPFKSALMGAAEAILGTDAAGQPVYVPVQPVSVAYIGLYGMPMGRENRPLFAWYGDMELVPHLWEAVKTGPIEVTIIFHEPMTVADAGGRKKLAAIAEDIVRSGQVRALAGLLDEPVAAPAPAADEEIAEAAA
ncbi:MAG: 1-acyl-sn-glycerol-3-phosphate acyltransferase [Alphaproteobacteria bacterium]|jgi:1-acyl-sn-glycerol-3-phosphate acyltransferase|nr:1-acyl-sn-glycerol-3-phosphate acyltransferase [Alphaproteobacteria bacterium]MBN9592404.1 1-acyl-sn-glycerol-3-phosphate acyltransferase [Alphaproteobacteria bacterium]